METPQHSDSSQEKSDFDEVIDSHKSWLKSVLGLGALEAKLWVTSSAQLLALMCGVIFLLLTTWLLIIASSAAIAWSYGFSLVGILLTATLVTFLSAVVLLYLVKRTLKKHGFHPYFGRYYSNGRDITEKRRVPLCLVLNECISSVIAFICVLKY